MKNTYTKLQRVLALALTLVLCITLLPIDGLKASTNPALPSRSTCAASCLICRRLRTPITDC